MSIYVWDPNMDTAYLCSSELFQPLELPQTLEDVNNMARLVNDINSCISKEIKKDEVQGLEPQLLIKFNNPRKLGFLKCIEEISRSYFPIVVDSKQRINISLRIWSGCLN